MVRFARSAGQSRICRIFHFYSSFDTLTLPISLHITISLRGPRTQPSARGSPRLFPFPRRRGLSNLGTCPQRVSFSHCNSEPPAIPESPIKPQHRHSHRVSSHRRIKVAKPDIQPARQRLVSWIPTHSRRRLAPLAVEERVVSVRAAVDCPVGRFHPWAEIIAPFFDRSLHVRGEVLENGDEEAVGQDVRFGAWAGYVC